MIVHAFHGSMEKRIEKIRPASMGGRNGSVGGIGGNYSSSADVAVKYATDNQGETGSVYIVELDVTDYVTISESNYLTKEQIKVFEKLFEPLPIDVKMRLSVDIGGRKEQRFKAGEDDVAKVLFDEKKRDVKAMSEPIDRLFPVANIENGGFVIGYASPDLSFENVDTKKIHYALNLYSNQVATDFFKSISKGLELKGIDHSDYLSFKESEIVIREIGNRALSITDIGEKIQDMAVKMKSEKGSGMTM